jgi:hypothetical protein
MSNHLVEILFHSGRGGVRLEPPGLRSPRASCQVASWKAPTAWVGNGPRPPRLVLDEAAPLRDPANGILMSSSRTIEAQHQNSSLLTRRWREMDSNLGPP